MRIAWNKGLKNPRMKDFNKSQKMREAARKRMTEDNPMKNPKIVSKISGVNSYLWKGDKVGYSGLHKRIYSLLGKAKECRACGSNLHVEWANISGEYKTDLTDWGALCAICHRTFDRIAEKAWITRRKVK